MFISFLLSLSIAFGVWRRIVVTVVLAIEKKKQLTPRVEYGVYKKVNKRS